MYILPVVVLERGTLHSGCPRLEAQRASLFITKLGRKSSCVFVSEGEALQRRGGCSEFVFGGIYILSVGFAFPAFRNNVPCSAVSKHKFQTHMFKGVVHF
jgi:hypothetical protein